MGEVSLGKVEAEEVINPVALGKPQACSHFVQGITGFLPPVWSREGEGIQRLTCMSP